MALQYQLHIHSMSKIKLYVNKTIYIYTELSMPTHIHRYT